MVLTERQKHILFFAEYAGYAKAHGRLACAKELAIAEEVAAERGWQVYWQEEKERLIDAFGSKLNITAEQKRIDRGTLLCLCGLLCDEDSDFPLATLGMVTVKSMHDPYLRVVAAELALEALHSVA